MGLSVIVISMDDLSDLTGKLRSIEARRAILDKVVMTEVGSDRKHESSHICARTLALRWHAKWRSFRRPDIVHLA